MQDDEYYACIEILTRISTYIYLLSYAYFVQLCRVKADDIAVEYCSRIEDYAVMVCIKAAKSVLRLSPTLAMTPCMHAVGTSISLYFDTFLYIHVYACKKMYVYICLFLFGIYQGY
jgi:hypothetical protein